MAAPVALAFRIAANLDALRANLQDAQGQIETTKSAMQRMANSLDGSSLIANGNAMVKVVNDLGGAATLTNAEQAKVNATLTDALEKYAALGKEAPPGMRELADATKQVGEETQKSDSIFSGFISKYIEARAIWETAKEAYRTLVDFVTGSIDTYAQAEAAERRLTVAVQTQGYAIPGLAEQYKALGMAYEQTTAYSHLAIDSAQALFVQLGNVGPAMMDRAIQAATDLSSGLGIDLNSAVTMLSKAFEGHTTALGRYGIVLDQARVKSEGMTYVLDAIEGKVGGQAQAELDTYAGKVKQLGNAWDDLKEAVGGAIVNDELVKSALRDLKQGAEGAAGSTDTLTAAWDSFLAASPEWFKALKDLHQDMSDDAFIANQLADAAERMSRVKPTSQFAGTSMQALFGGHDKEMAQIAADQEEAWKKEAEAAKKYADAVQQVANQMSGADLAKKSRELNDALLLVEKSGPLSADSLQRFGDAAADLLKKGAPLSSQLTDLAVTMNGLLPPVKDGAVAMADLGEKMGKITLPNVILLQEEMDKLSDKIRIGSIDLGNAGLKVSAGFKEAVKAIDESERRAARGVQEMSRMFAQFGTEAGGAFGSILTGIGSVIAAEQQWKKASEDLDGEQLKLMKTIAAVAGAMSVWNSTANAGSKSAGALKGAISGAEAGAAFGPYGAAIGAAAGAIAGWIHNMNSGRDAVVKFADSFGGFDVLQKKLEALGAAGNQLWINLTQKVGKGDVAAAQAAITAITNAFANQDAYLQRLPNEMQKYGLTWEQAGHQAEQAHLDEIAKGLIQDFADLTKGGFDVSTVTKAMSSSIDDYIHEALRTGTEVPAAMKPLLQKMIDMGTLTDDAGNQITDLSTSGITFSETLTEGFQSVVDAINQMTEALTGSKPGSLINSLNQIGGVVVHPKIQPTYDGSDIPADWGHSGGGGSGPVPMAAGGDFFVTKPTTFLVGEKGPEYASFGGANGSRASSSPRLLQPIIVQVGQRQLMQAVIEVAHATKAA